MKNLYKSGKHVLAFFSNKQPAFVLTWKLEKAEKGLVFTMSGEEWRSDGRDLISCGQNCDKIAAKFSKDTKAARMVEIWKEYHLNDMHAGTIRQEAELKKHVFPNNSVSYYEWACEILKAANIYEVIYEGKPYRYGQAWLFRPIPDEIIEEISAW